IKRIKRLVGSSQQSSNPSRLWFAYRIKSTYYKHWASRKLKPIFILPKIIPNCPKHPRHSEPKPNNPPNTTKCRERFNYYNINNLHNTINNHKYTTKAQNLKPFLNSFVILRRNPRISQT